MKSLILMALLISSSFASTRVENILDEDSSTRLSHIEELQQNLSNAKRDLNDFEKALSAASKVESREKIFVTIRNVAGVSAALSLLATSALFYKAKIVRSEGSLYTLLMAYGGTMITGGTALVATGAEVGVYFSKNETKNLREKIKDLQSVLTSKQNELKTEVNLLCKEEPRHKLCY